MEEDFGHEAAENQLAAISTANYEERADLEVEALNDWEREHLGAGQDSDSDQWRVRSLIEKSNVLEYEIWQIITEEMNYLPRVWWKIRLIYWQESEQHAEY